MGSPPSTLQGVLLNAFNDQMKDKLSTREKPSFFEELITMAIHIDNRLAERKREGLLFPSSIPSVAIPLHTLLWTSLVGVSFPSGRSQVHVGGSSKTYTRGEDLSREGKQMHLLQFQGSLHLCPFSAAKRQSPPVEQKS